MTPKNFTFRSREFEQIELEYFIKPDEEVDTISGQVTPAPEGHPGEPQAAWGWQIWHKYWVEERVRFYESIGLERKTLVEYWQKPDELAHYAKACVDILFKFPFGKRDASGQLCGEELEGIAARSDFDLSQHQRFSGKPATIFDEELKNAWAKLDEAKKKAIRESYYAARYSYLTKSVRLRKRRRRLRRTMPMRWREATMSRMSSSLPPARTASSLRCFAMRMPRRNSPTRRGTRTCVW